MAETLKQQYEKLHPSLAARAKKSPLPAIRMFCILCFGGARGDVTTCPSVDCSLYPFRMGHRPTAPAAADEQPKPKRAAPQALLDHIQKRRDARSTNESKE
jgi:hypothetical protein